MTDVHSNETLKGCVIKVRIFCNKLILCTPNVKKPRTNQLTFFAEEKYLDSIEITYEMLQAK